MCHLLFKKGLTASFGAAGAGIQPFFQREIHFHNYREMEPGALEAERAFLPELLNFTK